jgi:hypothetical protein
MVDTWPASPSVLSSTIPVGECHDPANSKENPMSKRARKRRDRKKNAASHGKRPNT